VTEDIWDHPDVRAWVKAAREDLVPKIEGSAATIQLWPRGGDVDVKIAVELGFTLMLGKPLIILKPAGENVPVKLVQLADAIVEYDELNAGVMERVHAEVERILRERGEL
jgi:hypothetical protein